MLDMWWCTLRLKLPIWHSTAIPNKGEGQGRSANIVFGEGDPQHDPKHAPEDKDT